MPPGSTMFRFFGRFGENVSRTREAFSLSAVKRSGFLRVSAQTYHVRGRHECLPYSKDDVRLKLSDTNLLGCLADLTAIFNHPRRGFHNCQLVIFNCQFGEAAKRQSAGKAEWSR